MGPSPARLRQVVADMTESACGPATEGSSSRRSLVVTPAQRLPTLSGFRPMSHFSYGKLAHAHARHG